MVVYERWTNEMKQKSNAHPYAMNQKILFDFGIISQKKIFKRVCTFYYCYKEK